jgi:hypothetical protein
MVQFFNPICPAVKPELRVIYRRATVPKTAPSKFRFDLAKFSA